MICVHDSSSIGAVFYNRCFLVGTQQASIVAEPRRRRRLSWCSGSCQLIGLMMMAEWTCVIKDMFLGVYRNLYYISHEPSQVA